MGHFLKILVLCTGNSARSILLECLLNTLGRGHVDAVSAGSKPAGQVHPGALSLLKDRGFATQHLRSKSWDEFAGHDAPKMDLVITVCGNARYETCPIWPGAPLKAHWGVEDPAHIEDPDEQMAAFEEAYRILKLRTVSFLDLDASQRSAENLPRHLASIGQIA